MAVREDPRSRSVSRDSWTKRSESNSFLPFFRVVAHANRSLLSAVARGKSRRGVQEQREEQSSDGRETKSSELFRDGNGKRNGEKKETEEKWENKRKQGKN